MTDHSLLKGLADACPPPGTYHYQSKEWAALMEFQAAVEDVYGSDVGMAKALIAEIESLREHKKSLVDLREAHGYESWASVLVMVDKLKTENEALLSLLGQSALAATTLRTDAEALANHSGFNREFVDFIRAKSGVEVGHGYGSSKYPKQKEVLAVMSKGDKP